MILNTVQRYNVLKSMFSVLFEIVKKSFNEVKHDMRFVSIKATVCLFGMLKGVNSLWIIFRMRMPRACVRDQPTDRIAQVGKIQ